MNKRTFFIGSLILLVLVLIFLSINRKPNKITLNIVGEALPPLESLGELAKEYTNITNVTIEIHPFEFETALSKTILDYQSKSPQYDIAMGIFYNHGKYFENGYITPFSDFVENNKTIPKSNFYEPLQEVCMDYNQELIGYPFSAQTMFLWYRKDLFENESERNIFKNEYGYELPVPDEKNLLNWEQYEDIADFFTRKKGESLGSEVLSENFYGTILQLKKHPCSFYEFTNFIYSFGGSFYNDSGELDVVNSNNIEALDFYLNLRHYSPPGVTSYTWDDALAFMQQGKIAMTIMWSDAPSALYDKEDSKVIDKIGYSLVPIKADINKKVAVFGGWSFLINAKGKHKNEAYDFIQWACSPDIQLRWAKMGGLPASKNIFLDEEYLNIPYMKAQNEALKNLVSWPRNPQAENFITLGQEALSHAATKQFSATEALQWLQNEMEKNEN